MELLKTTDPEILRDSIARYLQEQSEAPHLRFLSALVACRTHNFNTEQQNHLIGSILNLKRNGINFDSLIEICIGYLSVDQQSLWEFLILLIDRLYNDLGDDIFKRILLKLPASFGEESIEILKDRMKYNALYSRLKKLQSVLGDNK